MCVCVCVTVCLGGGIRQQDGEAEIDLGQCGREKGKRQKKGRQGLGSECVFVRVCGSADEKRYSAGQPEKKRASQEDGRSIPPPSLTTNTPFFPPLSGSA